ncbi:GM12405 [Drosophila sechellia]|uniref:GM12405 n=1 Tax=Drosophila sechellia TaxID=7238 RepID=B4I0Q1_DROSE|nr:GM12405 [Drosophila sechellia]
MSIQKLNDTTNSGYVSSEETDSLLMSPPAVCSTRRMDSEESMGCMSQSEHDGDVEQGLVRSSIVPDI